MICLATNSYPVARFCCNESRNLIKYLILLEKRRHLLVSSLVRSSSSRRLFNSQIQISKRQYRLLKVNQFLNTNSALFQSLLLFRNYSVTSRVFSATPSSPTSSVQYVSPAVLNSSSPIQNVSPVTLNSSSSLQDVPMLTVNSSSPIQDVSTLTNESSLSLLDTVSVNTSASGELLFSDFFPIYGCERGIESIHQITGLPWWATIVLTAFLLRIVLILPITIHSFHNLARLQNLTPEVTEKAERLKKEIAMAMHQFRWDEKRAKLEYKRNFNRLLKELYIRDNCHPLKGVASFWIQIPIWISVSYALRNLSLRAVNSDLEKHADVKSLTEEGLAWFPDLTVTDSTWLLPFMLGTLILVNTEIGYLSLSEVTKYRKWLTYGLRGSALLFVAISSTMPSSMVLYWVSSSIFGTVQTLLFDYSPFRRLVGLPKSNIESHTPLKDLRHRAVTRYRKNN